MQACLRLFFMKKERVQYVHTYSKVRLSCDFKSKHKTWVSKSNTTMAKWARQFNREITVWDQHPQFQMDAGTQQQNQQRKIEKKWLNEAIAKCASGDVHFSAEIVSAFHRKSNLLDSNCCVWICIPASQPKLSTEWTLFKRRNQISSTKNYHFHVNHAF